MMCKLLGAEEGSGFLSNGYCYFDAWIVVGLIVTVLVLLFLIHSKPKKEKKK
jgi:hypothetical protein